MNFERVYNRMGRLVITYIYIQMVKKPCSRNKAGGKEFNSKGILCFRYAHSFAMPAIPVMPCYAQIPTGISEYAAVRYAILCYAMLYL